MITLQEAKNLKHGDILYHVSNKNRKGNRQRWSVNGKVQTWKRSPERVKVPVKSGMYSYGYLTERELNLVSLSEEETFPEIMEKIVNKEERK